MEFWHIVCWDSIFLYLLEKRNKKYIDYVLHVTRGLR